LTIIPANQTAPGETWTVEIQPFDGTENGRRIQLTIFIESRPLILESKTETLPDREGHYLFLLNATDARGHSIGQVQYVLNFTGLGLPLQVKWADWNASSGYWELDYLLPDPIDSFLNINLSIRITVKTGVAHFVTGDVYEIATIMSSSFMIEDKVAPRVEDAFFIPDDAVNPTSLNFYANIEEFGSEIITVTLLYHFRPVNYSEGGMAAQVLWNEVEMVFDPTALAPSRYSISVNFMINTTDLEVIYRISTQDSAGNANPSAFDIMNFPMRIRDQRFFYRPTPFPLEILLLASLVVIGVITGSYIYIRYIRKPELIGLDKETVLENIPKLNEVDIRAVLNTHTLGIIISFFDQRYGPVPIVTLPKLLQDNFPKLLELADRSFSGTGFADAFDIEIPSSYDFILDRGVRVSVMSWGFSLDRPQARGGQENLTLNILLHKDVFPLVNQFQEEIQIKIHKIHMLMKKSPPEKDAVGKEAEELRTYISAIILAYEGIYGTTDLLLEED
jgi:hypothetical protein